MRSSSRQQVSHLQDQAAMYSTSREVTTRSISMPLFSVVKTNVYKSIPTAAPTKKPDMNSRKFGSSLAHPGLRFTALIRCPTVTGQQFGQVVPAGLTDLLSSYLAPLTLEPSGCQPARSPLTRWRPGYELYP